jgi:hypothetical protein
MIALLILWMIYHCLEYRENIHRIMYIFNNYDKRCLIRVVR